MNNIKFLLLGTSLSLIPSLTFAQCVATQDCATLGYTETSCNGGKGVKCPFGNLWACLTSEEECLNLACDKLGFTYTCTGSGEKGVGNDCNGKYQGCSCNSPYAWNGSACTCPSTYQYTCSGTGYSGGSGTACGGKYTSCTCASGYEWNGSGCQKQVLNGAVGELYYCNGTVVGVKASGMNFYVAMKDLGKLTWTSANSQCQSYLFCGNIKGTLPTKDQLVTLYNNKFRVNTLLSTNGGTQLSGYYWSSTSYSKYDYYFVNMSNGSLDWDYVTYSSYVRPVLTSY